MDLSNSLVSKAIIKATDNPDRFKDARKFEGITKFIGRGSTMSSTNMYRVALKPIANTGLYKAFDIVGVSVEGNRRARKLLDKNELSLALKAGCTIITDNLLNRSRRYNIGERELAYYLMDHGYVEQGDTGIWKLK